MISYLDKMNLRPAEKRLVVAAALALFVVLNLIFVVPKFGEWGRIENRMAYSRQQMAKYKVEVDNESKYRRDLERLKKIGLTVPSEDQALELSRRIDEIATLAGVTLQNAGFSTSSQSASSKTNSFFEERSATLVTSATEKQLIDFLNLMGGSDSLIRVRSMNVSPEMPARMKLGASLTVVASFQKKAPVRASAASTPSNKAVNTNTLAPSATSPFKAGVTNHAASGSAPKKPGTTPPPAPHKP